MSRPQIAVLLATYNGERFVREQIASIQCQEGVHVTIFASDDWSTDGTWELLHEAARADGRIIILPRKERFGCAARNFYHLLLSVDPLAFDAVALADQDDIWEPWRLLHHYSLLISRRVGGVSSSVIAFWPDGRVERMEKAGKMRRFDYLFQSPGPGCTFLLSRQLTNLVQLCLLQEEMEADKFVFHDWLIYAISRACGEGWHISERPSIRYRQHDANEWGANVGRRAVRRRMAHLLDGSYGGWASGLLRIVRSAAVLWGVDPPPERVSALEIALEGRRRTLDGVLISMTHPFGIRAQPRKGGGL